MKDPDNDNDGLSDEDEVTHGTNPINPDTDGDGVKDGDEVKAGTNSLVSSSKPTTTNGSQSSATTDSTLSKTGNLLKTGSESNSAGVFAGLLALMSGLVLGFKNRKKED